MRPFYFIRNLEFVMEIVFLLHVGIKFIPWYPMYLETRLCQLLSFTS